MELHTLRTRLLIALDRVYPKSMDDVALRSADRNDHSLASVRRDLHYLSEKGLVSLDGGTTASLLAAITAKGRDFVAGDIDEIGILPVSTYGYRASEDFQ